MRTVPICTGVVHLHLVLANVASKAVFAQNLCSAGKNIPQGIADMKRDIVALFEKPRKAIPDNIG
jgi:hypothetical protein